MHVAADGPLENCFRDCFTFCFTELSYPPKPITHGEDSEMRQSKPIIIGILAAAAVILVGVAGYAIASPYMYQGNMMNNGGGSCSYRMMGGQMMSGMMGTTNHMGGSGMQCPYHPNRYSNSTTGVAMVNYSFGPQIPACEGGNNCDLDQHG